MPELEQHQQHVQGSFKGSQLYYDVTKGPSLYGSELAVVSTPVGQEDLEAPVGRAKACTIL